jgi:CDGSH iron-sulfur domain-containing protein 3
MSGEGFIADLNPYAVEVEEGQVYFWCTCGHSERQPYCDGAHAGTDKRPMVFKAERTETVNLCGCKQSQNPPFCDGTHNIV